MKIKPEIITHIYPIAASNTSRLAHTGVPKSVNQVSYTKQLQMDIIRSVAAEGKCIATLDNENLEEVRAYAHGDLVPGSWDTSQVNGVSSGPIGPGTGIDYVGQRMAITNKRVWMFSIRAKKATVDMSISCKIFADDGYPGTLIDTAVETYVVTSTSYQWFTFTFINPPNLNGTYRIVAVSESQNGFIEFQNTDVISGNYCWADGTWTDVGGSDLKFQINYLPVAYLKIYKNGSPIGSEFDNLDGADFVEIELADDLGPFYPDNDTVELWGFIDNTPGGGNHTFSIDEFKLKYDNDPTKIKGAATYS